MLILLPPSEGKCEGGTADPLSLTRDHVQPVELATTASEKDLKCTGQRYAQGMALNRAIHDAPTLPAIQRYDGVMYRAIDYVGMSADGQGFFDNHVRILSGMYGILSPQDCIANYKLPVTTSLKHFWKKDLTAYLQQIENQLIIDLLPQSYRGMIDRKQLDAHVVQVQWIKPDGHKLSHGVKGVKGRWLHQLCEDKGGAIDRMDHDIFSITIH